jgi:molybdate transport system substrate-binding protein
MNVRRLDLIAVLAVGFISQLSVVQEITVAAAADLQFAMQDVAARFQKETGKTVTLIYGLSGNLFQQIQNGAPFDIFLSANLDYPRKLKAAGLTEPKLLPIRNRQDCDLGSEELKTRPDVRYEGPSRSFC